MKWRFLVIEFKKIFKNRQVRCSFCYFLFFVIASEIIDPGTVGIERIRVSFYID